MNDRTIIISALALLSIGLLGRLLPHLPNATPMTAIIFSSTLFLGRRLTILLPLAILLLTDIVLGFYSPFLMLSVYLSFTLIILLAWWSKKYSDIIVTSYTILASSLLFFIITNTAVWWFSPWYDKSLTGLLYCFELALPFLRNMLLGDLIYVPLVLGSLYLVSQFDNYPIFKLNHSLKPNQ